MESIKIKVELRTQKGSLKASGEQEMLKTPKKEKRFSIRRVFSSKHPKDDENNKTKSNSDASNSSQTKALAKPAPRPNTLPRQDSKLGRESTELKLTKRLSGLQFLKIHNHSGGIAETKKAPSLPPAPEQHAVCSCLRQIRRKARTSKEWTSCWIAKTDHYLMRDMWPLPKPPSSFQNLKRAKCRPGVTAWDQYLLEVAFKKDCCLEESAPKFQERCADLHPEMDQLYGHHRYTDVPTFDDDPVEWEYMNTQPQTVIFGKIDAGAQKGYVYMRDEGIVKQRRIQWLGTTSDWTTDSQTGERVRKDGGQTWKEWEKKAPYRRNSQYAPAKPRSTEPPTYPLFKPQLIPKTLPAKR
ncbi:hypothetical protein K402DRAFT_426009 [Aulographum hederae CBS 113979]|uniref:Uncharacterized protein n=1 Tax=Aulographum hederae CBS 113979 TaxID=1176131 RepID=A0A6G1GID6_9PEZI|nr:hypothetical protein K402DRAFT_426009 [Aulographum hederae CBS 113979]